jgi:hypothetical protein
MGFGFSMENGILKWTGGANITLEEAMRAPIDTSTKTGQAEEFLFKQLKDGPVLQGQLETEGAKLGLTPDALRRAKDRMDIKSSHRGFGGPWPWELATDERPF